MSNTSALGRCLLGIGFWVVGAGILPNGWAGASDVAPAPDSVPAWHGKLCLGNGGWWRQRIRIVVRNDTEQPAAGVPVPINIGNAPGQVNLEGASAEALRLVNETGVEMLWLVTAGDGQKVRRGPIPGGSVLTVPAECPGRTQAVYFLYFDNPSAWVVPDVLDAPTGLRNGGLEEGKDSAPAGWVHDEPDAKHRAAWVAENPHSGRRCLKTEVADGAETTWISTRQTHIYIYGGACYVFRGWVKAENVKGWAGYYIHVGNATNYLILGPMLNGGGGTYGWKEVRTEFVAPPEATVADLGTVLRGTGTAWFDDVSLDRVGPGGTLPLSPVGA